MLAGGTSGYEKVGSVNIHKPSYFKKFIGYFRQFKNTELDNWCENNSLKWDEPKFWLRYKIYADAGAQIICQNNIQIIAAYNVLSYGPVGAHLASRFGLPLVINIFGEIYKYNSMHKNKSFFLNVLNKANLLLSCSTHCGNSIRQLGCEAPVETVTYGVNTEHFCPGESKDLRLRLNIGSELVVLFVGRLDSEMGLDSFLKVAQQLENKHPQIRFIMVGQTGNYSQLAHEACDGTNGRLMVRQNVSYRDLPDYYRMADVIVVPTRGERTCSSLAAMEAMATCKAVVGYAIGGIPEIVEHEKTGLLSTPEDINNLAKAVDRLLSDESLRVQLAKAGYEKSKLNFSENRVNRVMEQHYNSLLSTQ